MPRIVRVRPILLSAPYGDPENSMENRLHLPGGVRTSGFVEITLDDGTTGVGEGYLAVFAPHVFRSIVDLLIPMLLGRDPRSTDIGVDLVNATGYWSQQGAARHAVSAIEIALQDCRARLEGVPVWKMLGVEPTPTLSVYASGGDSIGPEAMAQELLAVTALGITTFKIRGRAHQVDKVAWTQARGATSNIQIAVDMTQNLVIPSQTTFDVLSFVRAVVERSGLTPAFLEEVLGPDQIGNLPSLRQALDVPVAGGEIVTTEAELIDRMTRGCYDIAQPDATVIGGIAPVLEVFSAAQRLGTQVCVHCWGAGVGVLANYHAAAAGGGSVVEWPLPDYPLRHELLKELISIDAGRVTLSHAPGLGIELTADIEREFAFREDAVYDCVVDPARFPSNPPTWISPA